MKNLSTIFTHSRRNVLALAFLSTLGLGACEVTDLQPQNQLSEAAVFTDPARIALAVAGVYDAAQSGFYDPLTGGALAVRGYPFGAAANALDDARGEDVSDMAGFFSLVFTNQITPSSPNLVNMWSTCYAVVNKANVTIDGVRQAAAAGIITAEVAQVYEGELRFLRALAHHELVIHFSRPYTDGNGSKAGVPYRDVPANTIAGVNTGRSQDRGTVADDYTKMLADLDFAESNLPATRTITGAAAASATRATKGAAIALKQRLRLHQANWAAAAAEGTKLISGTSAPFTSPIGSYALAATQRAAFPGGAAATAETVFSVENRSDDNAGVNGALANVYGSSATPANGGINGRALLAVSPNLYNAPFFTCGDLRRTAMMQQDGVRPAYVLRKYTDATTSSDFAPIIRYAEVLLNQAEAVARAGNDDAFALRLLNAVRNRSVTTAADQYAAGSLTGPALIRAILNERRIEFVGEGKRWGDISRLSPDATFGPGGIPAKFNGQVSGQVTLARYACNNGATLATPSVSAVPYNSTFFLWPIPAIEIANNPTLAAQQNPGY
ncbi:RagB/SusD family nutrient uptake outer membrane protein [Microvirga sp. STR05]|uniref:RagB/SusD family nutrient uptake outer membrane protein n=1 Tax=Hymenobacter duratus TaxID=2771356 RepID=A0ABR8JHE2_9BACT|nr:RagB/SusD family nutrient uptake outer membrane protein [Hymenobacter duratus]MBD2714767.1 RagB/SusD family nutrient uptake outer membrane protein [Hymenobacter duratus]MBR7949672.1 RagB/SusD family nutrient uptake outer membrane protein [Microvirga sp. STR05]